MSHAGVAMEQKGIIERQTNRIRSLEIKLRKARDVIRDETGRCCEDETRSMQGGCINCGDPCL
jgi:hypothetical protein